MGSREMIERRHTMFAAWRISDVGLRGNEEGSKLRQEEEEAKVRMCWIIIIICIIIVIVI